MPLMQDGTSLSQPFFESCLLCFALLCYLLCESFKKSPLQACKVQWWCSGHDPSSQCHALTMPHTHTRMSLHATLKHASQRQSAVYVCCLCLLSTSQTHHFEACHWECRAAPGAVAGVVGVCRECSPGLLYYFDRPFRCGCFAFASYHFYFGCRQGGGLRWPVVAESARRYPASPTPHALGSEWCVSTLPAPTCLCLVYVHTDLSMSSIHNNIQTSLCRAYTTTYRPLYVEHTQQRTDLSMSSIHNNI